MAADSAPGSNVRNVFIEGNPRAVQKAKDFLMEIIKDNIEVREAIEGNVP